MSDTPNGKSPLWLAREAEGLAREKVAAEIGVSSKTIERWEKGESPIPRFRLRELAKLYGVRKLSDLMQVAA